LELEGARRVLLGPERQQQIGNQRRKPFGLVEPDVARNAERHQELGLVMTRPPVMDDQAIGRGTDGALPAVPVDDGLTVAAETETSQALAGIAGAAEAAGQSRFSAGAHGG